MTDESKRSPLILAVDDDRSMLMMLESMLEEQDYKVLTATNGKEACEIIEQHHNNLDAILLDREMPIMDGLEVVNWIKRQQDITNVPIIMQTGANRPEQIKEGIDSGVFYYLVKPIDPNKAQIGHIDSSFSITVRYQHKKSCCTDYYPFLISALVF